MINAFLISLWAAVAFALYFQEFTRQHLKLRIGNWQPFNRKPFNCETCLPFWLFAVFLLSATYVRHAPLFIAGLAGACTAGIITPLIVKYLHK